MNKIIMIIYSFFISNICLADSSVNMNESITSSLKSFLQTLDTDKTARYIATFKNLDDKEGAEAIVYLVSRNWCGSGGCNTLILTQNGNSWTIITNIKVTRPPIRMLDKKNNGWHSIGVWVQGGGIQHGYEAKLDFNGKTYPQNPTILSARKENKTLAGEVVISSMKDSVPLY